MKRPLAEADHVSSLPSKRPRSFAPIKAHYREVADLLLPANPQDPSVLDGLIDRTLAIALHTTGFDAVKKDALESLRNMFDEYLIRITHLTSLSLKSGRRSKAQPQDVAFALRHDGTRLDSLDHDLVALSRPRHAVIRRTTQPTLFSSNPSSSTTNQFAFPGSLELSQQLGGATDKQRRSWIPRHFPSFPPPHTYKQTSIPLSSREMDPRKVREKATEEGVLAERALRKLVGARQTTGSHDASRAGSRPGTRAGNVEKSARVKKPDINSAFKQAMDAALIEDRRQGRESLQQEDEMLFLDGSAETRTHDLSTAQETPGEDMAFGAIVNWDRGNWRSGGRDIVLT